jgi:hypothetical protein
MDEAAAGQMSSRPSTEKSSASERGARVGHHPFFADPRCAFLLEPTGWGSSICEWAMAARKPMLPDLVHGDSEP